MQLSCLSIAMHGNCSSLFTLTIKYPVNVVTNDVLCNSLYFHTILNTVVVGLAYTVCSHYSSSQPTSFLKSKMHVSYRISVTVSQENGIKSTHTSLIAKQYIRWKEFAIAESEYYASRHLFSRFCTCTFNFSTTTTARLCKSTLSNLHARNIMSGDVTNLHTNRC